MTERDDFLDEQLDAMLAAPMPEFSDNTFTHATMTRLIAKQKRYQVIKNTVFALVIVICTLLLLAFDFTVFSGFPLSLQFIDLSSLFMANDSMMVVGFFGFISIAYLVFDALEAN